MFNTALATAGTHLQRSLLSFERYLEEYKKRWLVDPRRPVNLSEYQNFPPIPASALSNPSLAYFQKLYGGSRSDTSNPPSSNPPSIFSLQSIQSTTLTADTHLTAGEMNTAIDKLVGIFMNDKEMAPLYPEAIVESRITAARFVRNFRRLLKSFAVGLEEGAQEAIDLDLANLIWSRAGLIADQIGNKLDQQYFNQIPRLCSYKEYM